MKFLFKNEVVDYDCYNNANKETILFLHGWGGNKFSFLETINLTKKHFNILSVTMPTTNPTTSVWDMLDYVSLIENLLALHNIKEVNIICHSFGFRVAMLLNKKIIISKLIVTAGAGIKKENIFLKTIKNNNKILINNKKFNYLFKKIASVDYLNLSQTNQKTFKNIVNFNLKFATKFSCHILLFWGIKDTDTKLWIAKHIKHNNNAKLITTRSDHFAYIKESSKFNHEVLKFLKTN